MNASDKTTLIRLAQLSDVPAIRLLIRLSCRELMINDYSARQVESMLRYALDIDRQLILDGTYYIAECNGRIAGIGGWSFRPSFNGQLTQTPPSPRLYPGKDPAMVRLFFVHPDFARRGIGRLLMSTCEGAAQRAGFKELELAATLTGAQLYLSCGFEVVSRFENTLPDGVVVAGLRMRKQLPQVASLRRARREGSTA
jgi:GNAT superfamily N-acetyltransferase